MSTTELAPPPIRSASPIAELAARVDARLLAVAGSLAISLSSTFVKLSETSSGTNVFFRCLLALPFLLPLAWWERRRAGAGAARPGWRAALGGALLGVDLVLWCESIASVGAGIATVLVAVQVVIVPGLAFLFFGERPSARYLVAVPVMLGGIVLAGGVADSSAFGPDPLYGTVTGVLAGVAYGGYLLLLRAGSGPGTQAQTVCVATIAAGAVALAIGLPWHGVDLTPGWPSFGWLIALAVSGQAVGWLFVAAALPRLSASVGATLLLLQPIIAVLLGVVVLGEDPSPLQFTGCAVVIAAVCFATLRPAKLTEGKAR
ncbi:DMT family transporter [Amycolatopsis nigrescens]|uniref:DMT family transporter n=1 Tax=Amycolatopsis nigrescens TaxID=381445 RepID=UPI00036A6BC4|nr:DMT family transporter [Amycolatopsis nigrescens]